MSNSVIPIQQAFDYQARLFWLKVCDLFLPNSKVKSVGYELDEVKSFDDVVVTYSEPIPETNGLIKNKDYYQSKFHSHQTNPIYYTSLIDPAFIGATANSFLQKLSNAFDRAEAEKQTHIYNLFTPSTIHPDDSLSKLYSNFDNTLNINRLYEGKTEKSEFGEIRLAWINHLRTSEENLRNLILRLKIINGPSSKILLDALNIRLTQAGFKPIETGSISNAYDDLVRKLHQAGRNNFDRDEIQQIAEAEKIWVGKSATDYPAEKTIGIRSFIKFAEEMPNLTFDMICLASNFDGRFIKSANLWNDEILPQTAAFIQKYEDSGETIYVLLDTHTSVAFAAGHSVHPKAATKFVPVQKNEFRHPEVWNVQNIQSAEKGWQTEEIQIRDAGSDLAVAVGVTHAVAPDVKEFVARSLPLAGKILSFEIQPKPGTNSVKDGSHAFALAEELAQRVIGEVKSTGWQSVHIFASAPVGFMFYLGKKLRLPASCRIYLYEYDFESKELGAYIKSIVF